MIIKLSSKGQLVIPKSVRQALGLQTGATFHVDLENGKIILEPLPTAPITALYGKYADADFLTDLETEHRHEVANDAALHA